MLVHTYLGALVFGGVLLAASLLVGKAGPLKLRSLAFWGFALSFFGLTTVGLRLSGLTDESTTAGIGGVVGVSVAVLVLVLSQRRGRR